MRGVSGRGLGLLGTAWTRGRGEGMRERVGRVLLQISRVGGQGRVGTPPPFLRDAGEVRAEAEADLVC